jgi:hypothetical protein
VLSLLRVLCRLGEPFSPRSGQAQLTALLKKLDALVNRSGRS